MMIIINYHFTKNIMILIYIYKKNDVNKNIPFNSLIHIWQCSKLLPVRQPEADNFGGGPETFLKLFFNFMFMIWDSRQQVWQLFWLSFEHCIWFELVDWIFFLHI